MSSKEAHVRAVDLCRGFRMPHGKRIEVLEGASVEVARGESLGIMGKSGSGKSTILYVLAGLDKADRGDVWIDGEKFSTWKEGERASFRAKKMGFVFQSYHLMPELNVLENVLMPARSTSLGSKTWRECKDKAKHLLEEVGLGHRLGHRPMELSGGEQQRVAIARALVQSPEILFADEPTGNLDDDTGSMILEHLFRLSREAGLSMIMVTHNPVTASLCDRTAVLQNGKFEEA